MLILSCIKGPILHIGMVIRGSAGHPRKERLAEILRNAIEKYKNRLVFVKEVNWMTTPQDNLAILEYLGLEREGDTRVFVGEYDKFLRALESGTSQASA